MKTVTRFRPMASGLALLLTMVALLVSSCSTGDRLNEVTFERERALEALKTSLEQREKDRTLIKELRAENSELGQTVKNHEETIVPLKETVETLEVESKTAREGLSRIEADHAKLNETYTKLQKMAQESLGELSELRQKGDSLATDRERLENLADVRGKQVSALTREVDDLRAELTRTRKAVRVIQENESVPTDTKNKNLEDVVAAQKNQIVAMSEELVKMKSTIAKVEEKGASVLESKNRVLAEKIDPDFVWRSTEKLFSQRYEELVQGKIAWDGFDIGLVAVASTVFLIGLITLISVFRAGRVRRDLRELQVYISQISDHQHEEELEHEPAAHVDAPSARGESRSSSRRPESRHAVSREDRISPDEFSSILRSQSDVRRAPAKRDSAGAASSDALSEIESGAAAPAANNPASRRIIGAHRAGEASPGQPAPAQPLPRAPIDADVEFDDDFAAQTQIISGDDLDLLRETELEDAPSLKATGGSPAPKAGKGASGADDEQELLKELKDIINKKFDNA